MIDTLKQNKTLNYCLAMIFAGHLFVAEWFIMYSYDLINYTPIVVITSIGVAYLLITIVGWFTKYWGLSIGVVLHILLFLSSIGGKNPSYFNPIFFSGFLFIPFTIACFTSLKIIRPTYSAFFNKILTGGFAFFVAIFLSEIICFYFRVYSDFRYFYFPLYMYLYSLLILVSILYALRARN